MILERPVSDKILTHWCPRLRWRARGRAPHTTGALRDRFESLGIETVYATEDGSLGERGLVTVAMDRFLGASMRAGMRLFACGPWAMMKATHQLAVRYRVPCDVSLEARMGCSLCACMGCVVRTTDDGGDEQYLRVCLEGPVMESRWVDWDTPPL